MNGKRTWIYFILMIFLMNSFNSTYLLHNPNENERSTINSETQRKLFKPTNEFERNKLITTSFFTKNEGQLRNETIIYYSENAYFTSMGISYRFEKKIKNDVGPPPKGIFNNNNNENSMRTCYYEVKFVDSNMVIPIGTEKIGGYSNFLLGNNSTKWITDVSNFKEIIYPNLYDNIDLKYQYKPEGLKYEFEVSPGGNISQIKMKYVGAEVYTDGNEIFVQTPFGNIEERDFLTYQIIEEEQVLINAKIIVKGNILTFDM